MNNVKLKKQIRLNCVVAGGDTLTITRHDTGMLRFHWAGSQGLRTWRCYPSEFDMFITKLLAGTLFEHSSTYKISDSINIRQNKNKNKNLAMIHCAIDIGKAVVVDLTQLKQVFSK